MSYDDKMEADTPGNQPNTQGTITTLDSYEFTQEEAEAIQKSMDLSMEFWGFARDASGIIPANRLKTVRVKPNRESEVAEAIWHKMKPDGIENVQKIEKIIMLNGEIKIDQLFEALESISEGVGLTFQDLFPESNNDDIIMSATDIMNELLSVYNEAVPLKDLNSNGRPHLEKEQNNTKIITNEKIEEKNSEICNKSQENAQENEKNPVDALTKIVDKTKEQNSESLKELSITSLSEHSKLRLLEKRMSTRIKQQILQEILNKDDIQLNSSFPVKEPEKVSAAAARREKNIKKRAENIQNRPQFIVPGKSSNLDWKGYPNSKNITSIQHNLRKAKKNLLENKEWEPSEPGGRKNRNARLGPSGLSKNNNRKAFIGRDEKNKVISKPPFTAGQKSSKEKNDHFQLNNSSTDLLAMINTDKIRHSKLVNRKSEIKNPEAVKTYSQLVNKTPSKDKVLHEVKKLLKEAMFEIGRTENTSHEDNCFRITREAQEQTSSHILTQYSQTTDSEIGLNLDVVKEHQTGRSSQCMTIAERDMNVDIQRALSKKEDMLDIKVTQESINPLLWPLMKESDRTITTEISLSQFNQAPTVKVSVINKVKSEEEGLSQLAKDQPNRVQEAVHYLTGLLESNATYRNESNSNELGETKPLGDFPTLHEAIISLREGPLMEGITKSEDSSALTMVTKGSENETEGLALDETKALLPTSLDSEGLLPDCQPVNVNMALILEDFSGFQTPRDDPRACRLFQLMMGEEPPNVMEEIGDVGGVWLSSHGSWSQQIWRNLSENVGADSMDSLFVHADNRTEDYPDIVREPCRSAVMEDAYQNLTVSTRGNYNSQIPEIDETDVGSDILLPPGARDESGLARAGTSAPAGVGHAAILPLQVRGKGSLTRTVLGVFGLLLTGLLVLKRPLGLPLTFLKQLWTGILGRMPSDIR